MSSSNLDFFTGVVSLLLVALSAVHWRFIDCAGMDEPILALDSITAALAAYVLLLDEAGLSSFFISSFR